MNNIDTKVQKLVESLDLPEEKILEKFSFYLGEKMLSDTDAKSFLSFLKKEL